MKVNQLGSMCFLQGRRKAMMEENVSHEKLGPRKKNGKPWFCNFPTTLQNDAWSSNNHPSSFVYLASNGKTYWKKNNKTHGVCWKSPVLSTREIHFPRALSCPRLLWGQLDLAKDWNFAVLKPPKNIALKPWEDWGFLNKFWTIGIYWVLKKLDNACGEILQDLKHVQPYEIHLALLGGPFRRCQTARGLTSRQR